MVLADAGYRHTARRQQITERGNEVVAPPDGDMREGTRPGWDREVYEQMRAKRKNHSSRL
jgi:hypothetical protein